MNVREAMSLRRRLREAKEMLDGEFNAAYEALGDAIRPHAQHDTNQVTIRPGLTPGYSAEELALISAMNAAGVLSRALGVTKDEVARASMGMPARTGEQA